MDITKAATQIKAAAEAVQKAKAVITELIPATAIAAQKNADEIRGLGDLVNVGKVLDKAADKLAAADEKLTAAKEKTIAKPKEEKADKKK